MNPERIEFRCPHCRRAYSLRLDADKLSRLDRIAVCGRCKKPFSLAQRVKEANTELGGDAPPVNELDRRAAEVAKRERERRRREDAAKLIRNRMKAHTSTPPVRLRGRADDSDPVPDSDPLRDTDPQRGTDAWRRIDAMRDTDPQRGAGAMRDTDPQAPHGKRRWDSIPSMPTERDPPPVPVRDSSPGERVPKTIPPQPRPSQPTDVFGRSSTDDSLNREALRSLSRRRPPPTTAPPISTTPPASSAPPPSTVPPSSEFPPSHAQSPEAVEPRERRGRRTTSPGLGRVRDDQSSDAPEPVLAVRRDAIVADTPPMESLPTPQLAGPIQDEDPSNLPFETEPYPGFDLDSTNEFDDDTDDFDEDAGDRVTLLLPDDGITAATALEQGTEPVIRNASARVVMSRNDWIKAADPGLAPLRKKPTDDVAALVALLELADPPPRSG
jgi:hypothetical protein